jgi:hypothetical protein
LIRRAVLSRIDRPAAQGRTGPVLAAIETEDGEEVEVFAKLSAGCDQGVVNLAREAIAACLAADLGLPVPRPWLVEVPPEILPVVANATMADKLRRSVPVAFGSTRAPEFAVWTPGHRLTAAMRPVAAGILLFDAIIQNPDRRAENPNCLVRGDDLRIIDHELAFMHRLILGWKAPWLMGGMRDLATPGRHIFVSGLKGAALDFEPIRSRWTALSDARLKEYAGSVPPEWAAANADIDVALKLIADARDNLDACIAELGRVLS